MLLALCTPVSDLWFVRHGTVWVDTPPSSTFWCALTVCTLLIFRTFYESFVSHYIHFSLNPVGLWFSRSTSYHSNTDQSNTQAVTVPAQGCVCALTQVLMWHLREASGAVSMFRSTVTRAGVSGGDGRGKQQESSRTRHLFPYRKMAFIRSNNYIV